MVSAKVFGVGTIPSCFSDKQHVRKLTPFIYETAQLLNEGAINVETTLQDNSQASRHMIHATLTRGMGWGLIGGLVGMLVVDLILMGALSAVGLPPLFCFSTVGNTAARFFSILGIDMAGGVPLGVATHYLVGPVLGAIFGAVLAQIGALQVGTLKKCVVFAVLYAEVVSQPLFVMMPLLLKMTASETLVWFVGSVVMHFIWGIVLGVFVSRGLRLATVANHR